MSSPCTFYITNYIRKVQELTIKLNFCHKLFKIRVLLLIRLMKFPTYFHQIFLRNHIINYEISHPYDRQSLYVLMTSPYESHVQVMIYKNVDRKSKRLNSSHVSI